MSIAIAEVQHDFYVAQKNVSSSSPFHDGLLSNENVGVQFENDVLTELIKMKSEKFYNRFDFLKTFMRF